MLDLTRFKVLTFDCYGTMIDWETGIFSALRPILAGRMTSGSPTTHSSSCIPNWNSKPSKENFCAIGMSCSPWCADSASASDSRPTDAEVRSLPESLRNWQPFPDTVEALRKLKSRYQLAVVSNVDDDLFASTAPKLGVTFDHVITAQQAGCYKPCMRMFKLAEDRIGVGREQWLHVGQSIYHDVIPAQSLGIATVWVNRPSPRPGAGAATAASGKPDLEVPDLQTLAKLAG